MAGASVVGVAGTSNLITAVVCNGKVIDGDGDDLQESRPALWWSFTKTVLAAAASALVRDGKLNLDVPVDDQPYTLRQLLRHTVYHFPDHRCTVATFAPANDQAIVEWAAHHAAMAHQ
ncbi:serine hydrolase [Herbaspirillum sp. meg3]|uniref:serine hydrolase n=1 Tax=Herbaspirillum sp. meg3 TaxID=2025949 RepID=UPI0018DF150B|nr:serine hydrolase [Herbaspirillum sp. meg3]